MGCFSHSSDAAVLLNDEVERTFPVLLADSAGTGFFVYHLLLRFLFKGLFAT